MGKAGKIAIVVVLAVAVATVIVMKKGDSTFSSSRPSSQPTSQLAVGVPRLVDLGSTTCIPCKMMAPILDELKEEYAGQMQVEFINVNEDPDAAKPFAVKLIPTQVFIDASGKELFRHVGFFSKEEILHKWKELGVSFKKSPDSVPAPPILPAVKSGST